MARVRMLTWISGGRHDGRDWPDPGHGDATIDVPDWEAEDLVRARLAVPAGADRADALPVRAEHEQASPPEPVPEPVPGQLASPAETAAGASAPPGDQDEAGQEDGANDEPADPEAEPAEAAPEPDAEAPAPSDPPDPPPPHAHKQVWIDYAISQGATEDEASAMTKADLMSRYGGRL